MTIAVVSGPAEELHAVAVALRRQGLATVVLGHREWTDEVPAGGAPPDPSPTPSSLADIGPGLSFSDWRTEVLSLTSCDGDTYFGWPTADGRWCTAVLRGPVLSPLPPFDVTTGSDASAASREMRAALFARTVLTDTGGDSARCSGCGGRGCDACHASGLAKWARQLVEDFVEEILPMFTEQCIEVAAADVKAWLGRRMAALVDREPCGPMDGHRVAPRTPSPNGATSL